MTTQEMDALSNNLSQLDLMITRIPENLNGEKVSGESLALAIKELCPNMSVEKLSADCNALMGGVQHGRTYAEGLLKTPSDMQQQALPKVIREEISNLDEDQKHQYLILLYQLMAEMVEKPISHDEVVHIANADNEELLDRLDQLSTLAKADITCSAAELIHTGISRLQEQELSPVLEQYSEEERTWILASAIYADALTNQPEEISAALIGEAVGASSATAHAFRNCMLSQVIPGAVAALSVAAICILACFAIKAVVTHSLFTTAFAFLKANMHAKTLQLCIAGGIMYVSDPITDALKQIASTAFSATAAITCRYLKEDAQEVFENNYQRNWLLPETSPISAPAAVNFEIDDNITVDEDIEEQEEI